MPKLRESLATPSSVGRSVAGTCFTLLVACAGPGESRIEVFAPQDASRMWERTLPTESFGAEDSPMPDALRVYGYDACWDALFVSDFDWATGEKLGDYPVQARAEFGGSPTLEPSTFCPGGSAERVMLSGQRFIEICPREQQDADLVAFDVETGAEIRIPVAGARDVRRLGDGLLVVTPQERQFEMFSLESAELLWSWATPDESTYVKASDDERLYVWQEATLDTYALSLADGSVVWQENLGCEWLSLTDGVLVCGSTLEASSCQRSD